MSTPVASASMSVPSGVISTAASPGVSESADALFDALFTAFGSPTGDGTDVANASPAAGNSCEPQSENSANPPSQPGIWMAQIDPADANAQNPDPSKKTAAGDELGGNNLPVQSDRNTAQVRTSHGAKPQTVPAQLLIDGQIAPNPFAKADQAGAPHNEESLPQSVSRTNDKNSQPSSAAQKVVEVLIDQLIVSAEPELKNASDVADQPTGPRPARSKEGAQRPEVSDKQDQSDLSELGSDRIPIAQIAQLESTGRPSALPSDTARFTSDHSQTHDENGKPAAVDTASTDRAAAQIPTRPESPKSTLAHINSSVRPDSNFASSAMNSPPSTPQPTDAGSAQKTTASTRNTTAAPVAEGSSALLEKADDVIRPQGGAQSVSFHHADAGTGGAPPQIATANSDAPVRIAFTATPNSVEQPAFDALALRIATRSSEGDRNFSIRLDPPELGRVEVSLSVNSTGHAQAEISADKPQTLDLLQRDAPALERALKDAGLNLAGGFAFSLKGEGRSGGSWRDLQHGARGRALHIAATEAASANASLNGSAALAARAYGMSASRLDIRV